MKWTILGKGLSLVLLVSIIVGTAMVAEAQRGRPMMNWQENAMDEWDRYDPRMMHGRGMMGPGMGMMCPMMGMAGPGMGMAGPGMGMMGPGMGLMGFLHLPDLTEEQRNEIRSILREVRREHMEIMADIMDYRDEMIAAMTEARPDAEAIRELYNSLAQRQGDLLESAVQNRNRAYEVLTEEQREVLEEMQQQPFERPGPRWDQQ